MSHTATVTVHTLSALTSSYWQTSASLACPLKLCDCYLPSYSPIPSTPAPSSCTMM
ncbi:hypothetical protein BDZ91DRAFT_714828 [Kalaharituber pfeilii]|nr:hypothetical protein BDZ91DRAFT_714828 [Kalaharituber pfeilii]